MAIAKDVADNAATALSEAEAGAIPNEVTNGDGESQEPIVSQKVVSKRRMEKEKAERVRDEIEGYCERFEKELLRLFDRSYRKGDPRMMAVSVALASRGPGTFWLTDLTSTAQKHSKSLTEELRVSRYTSISTTFSLKITARLKKMSKTASALICRLSPSIKPRTDLCAAGRRLATLMNRLLRPNRGWKRSANPSARLSAKNHRS